AGLQVVAGCVAAQAQLLAAPRSATRLAGGLAAVSVAAVVQVERAAQGALEVVARGLEGLERGHALGRRLRRGVGVVVGYRQGVVDVVDVTEATRGGGGVGRGRERLGRRLGRQHRGQRGRGLGLRLVGAVVEEEDVVGEDLVGVVGVVERVGQRRLGRTPDRGRLGRWRLVCRRVERRGVGRRRVERRRVGGGGVERGRVEAGRGVQRGRVGRRRRLRAPGGVAIEVAGRVLVGPRLHAFGQRLRGGVDRLLAGHDARQV